MGVTIDKVLEIYVPDETIQARVSGRRVCEGCGATYHIQYKPSKVEGVCDKCGAKTIIRKDDQPATVLDRLAVYHKQTEPLKEYYAKQGKLEVLLLNQKLIWRKCERLAVLPLAHWNWQENPSSLG